MNLSERLTYWLLCGLGYAISILPQWLINIKSNILFLLVFYIARYRRRVVMINLRLAFPDKSDSELHQIERKFYLHLTDLMFETFALIGRSPRSVAKRFHFTNPELIIQANPSGSVVSTMSHFGNWEMNAIFSLQDSKPIYAAYHPLHSQSAEMFYKKLRTRLGMRLVTMKNIGRVVSRLQSEGIYIGLIADQSPRVAKEGSWVDFMGRQTSFSKGIDTFALKYKLPILFNSITKVKRGYYQSTVKLIWDGKSPISSQEIIQRYASLLEEDIRREPHLWLWSHKRWKHTPDGVGHYKRK